VIVPKYSTASHRGGIPPHPRHRGHHDLGQTAERHRAVIRYHRNRFRGGSIVNPGSPRFELGCNSSRTPCTAW